MRRFSGPSLLHVIILLAAVLVFIPGCTRPLLQTYPASDEEIEKVQDALARFREMSGMCPCCLDAEVDAVISVSGWFRDHQGKLAGYLQAMQPGLIKFVAVNPLGQPLYILVTDGKIFKSLFVYEQKAYIGSVHSEAYGRFVPPGFEPMFSYYWLTGRLQPGKLHIGEVKRDREQDAFWLQLKHVDAKADSMVLFDPVNLLILRHVFLNEEGQHLVDISYADHQPFPGIPHEYTGGDHGATALPGAEHGTCKIPARVIVNSKTGGGKIEINLHSLLGDAHFSVSDFHLVIPVDFNQVLVK